MTTKLMKIFFAGCLLLNSMTLLAQNVRFPDQGVIEYEKKINTHAIMKRMMGGGRGGDNYMEESMESVRKQMPQFKVVKSTLTFKNQKALFTPEVVKENKDNMFGGDFFGQQNNIIYSDFSSSVATSQKKVIDETFLVKDSLRKILWKITDETRDIAGYNCRRANGLMLDSIYVVAFYTDKIPVSGGPESFNGLPGMILGVALPHENVTWFATKVNDSPVNPQLLVPPVKGKPMNGEGFRTYLNSAFKKWGGTDNSFLKGILL